ncbi:DUF1345 domain-containing protein [Streptomyces sp. NPDC026665]|uniref:DUF1345 domain-containing protein n=1 Tax=Streptomyces sp. NPDC026665 TaxID=3154798 RepID=UPI0033DFD409
MAITEEYTNLGTSNAAGRVSLAISRGIEGLLILLGISFFLFGGEFIIVPWELLAVVYLAVRIRRLKRSKRTSSDSTEWLRGILGSRIGTMFTLFSSAVGIVAGASILADKSLELKALGIPAVLLAWAMLHFGYAERYAHAYYAALPEGELLVFPDGVRPTFVDFAYFSFTVGTTFSVSDVETRTPAMRLRVLAHSIVSFIYNTAIIGIAVSALG